MVLAKNIFGSLPGWHYAGLSLLERKQ